jgi:hypothetical protein
MSISDRREGGQFFKDVSGRSKNGRQRGGKAHAYLARIDNGEAFCGMMDPRHVRGSGGCRGRGGRRASGLCPGPRVPVVVRGFLGAERGVAEVGGKRRSISVSFLRAVHDGKKMVGMDSVWSGDNRAPHQ